MSAYGRKKMPRGANNMSIGELEDFLRELPAELKHLPVKILNDGAGGLYIDPNNLTFTDGRRYYSLKSLEGRATFTGIYLEFCGEKND